MFAAPFASKPNVINSAGPTTPSSAVAITINFLVPSPKPLNLSSSCPITLTTGVTACKNVFPIGASESFSCSIDSLKFVPTASSTVLSSRSEMIASSSTDLPARSRTLLA